MSEIKENAHFVESHMKTQPINHQFPILIWTDQEPPARMIEAPARAIEVNDKHYDPRAARLGMLEHRQVRVISEQNIDLARFRI
jgi:hypothetical protein